MAVDTSRRCGAPVTVPGVFSAVTRDLGHPCVRAAGHDGVHRWTERWEKLPPAEVEAEIARDLETWEPDEDRDDDADADGRT